MPQPKYKFGRLSEPSALPSLNEFGDRIEHGDFPLIEEREEYTLRRGSRDPHHETDTDENQPGFFYYNYVSEIVETTVGLNDDGEDEERNVVGRDTMDFLIAENGRFVYESATDVGPGNALELLLGDMPEFESDITLPHEYLERFFHRKDHIGKATVEDVSSQNESDSELDLAVMQAGDMLSDIDFNTGDLESNLKNSDLVNAFVRHGRINFVKGDNDGEKVVNMSTNGWTSFSYPPSLDKGERARVIWRRVWPILDQVVQPPQQ